MKTYRLYTSGGYLKIQDIETSKVVSLPIQYTKYSIIAENLYLTPVFLGSIQNLSYRIDSLRQPNGTLFNSVDDLVTWLDYHTAICLSPEMCDFLDKNYIHIQWIASNVWSVNHNLNKYPGVTVFDNENNEIIASISMIDLNSLQVVFNTPEIGFLVCN